MKMNMSCLRTIIKEEVRKLNLTPRRRRLHEGMTREERTGTINDFMKIMRAGQGDLEKTKQAFFDAGYDEPLDVDATSVLLSQAFDLDQESEMSDETDDDEDLLEQRDSLIDQAVEMYADAFGYNDE